MSAEDEMKPATGEGAPPSPPADAPASHAGPSQTNAPAPSGPGGEAPARASLLALITQVGAIEFGLSLVLMGVGLWALITDAYDPRLSLMLGGGFVGAWALGALVRWAVGAGKRG